MSTYDVGGPLQVTDAPVVVFDLDSTMCNTLGRRHLAPPKEDHSKPGAWDQYSLGCGTDTPIEGTLELTRLLYGPNRIFLLSARSDVAMRGSRLWLLQNRVPYDRLRLHKAGEDDQSPSDFKIRVLRGWRLDGWNIRLFIDDWAQTCTAVSTETGIPTVTPAFLAGDYKPGH